MLGFFTDPYPDEILYSAAARYHHRARNRRTSATVWDWFAEDIYRPTIDFPSRLNHLISVLPKDHLYTADILIENHTLLPFYAPFFPAGRAEKIREYMRSSDKGGAIYPLLGLLTSKIAVNALRYCALCAQEDREQCGEAYWHRTHQIPGIFACAKHKLFLNEGYPHPRTLEDRNKHFVRAEDVIDFSLIRPLDLTNSDHQVHFRLAEDVEWISKNNLNHLILNDFNARYRYVLFKSRLVTFGGTVSLTEVIKSFTETFSEQTLKELFCEVKGKCTWIHRLFNEPTTSQHPIRHLLFVQFCRYSLKEFIELPTEINPFGQGPFPCLNPASNHFRESVVEKLDVINKQKSVIEIRGTFYCDCGFVYRKFERDEQGNRRFEFDRVVEYGEIWDNALKKVFNENKLNLKEIAEKFGVVKRTLLRQLSRLELTSKYNSLKPKRVGKSKISTKQINKKRPSYRKEWRKMKMSNPNFSRSGLRYLNESIYSWLYKNDKDWLNENCPEIRSKQIKRKFNDWEELDNKIASRVEELSAELKSLPGRPVFVSKTIVSRRLKTNGMLKSFKLIPKTVKALKICCETYEEYTTRRIDWGIKQCIKDNRFVNQWDFMRLTGISLKYFNDNPLVRSKVYEALKIIESRTKNF